MRFIFWATLVAVTGQNYALATERLISVKSAKSLSSCPALMTNNPFILPDSGLAPEYHPETPNSEFENVKLAWLVISATIQINLSEQLSHLSTPEAIRSNPISISQLAWTHLAPSWSRSLNLHDQIGNSLRTALRNQDNHLSQNEKLTLYTGLANFGTSQLALAWPEYVRNVLHRFDEDRAALSEVQLIGIENLERLGTVSSWVALTKALVMNTQLGDGTLWLKLVDQYFASPSRFKLKVLQKALAELKNQTVTDNLLNPKVQAEYIRNQLMRAYVSDSDKIIK